MAGLLSQLLSGLNQQGTTPPLVDPNAQNQNPSMNMAVLAPMLAGLAQGFGSTNTPGQGFSAGLNNAFANMYQSNMLRHKMTQDQKEMEMKEAMFDLQKRKLEHELSKPKARKYEKDAGGRLRYLDDGSFVFNDVRIAPEKGTTVPGFDIVNGMSPTPDDAKKLKETSITSGNIQDTISDLKKLTQEKGSEFIGSDSRLMEQLYNDAKLKVKDLYDLGAIQAPDVPLLEAAIPNPTSWSENAKSLVPMSNAKESMIQRFEKFEEMLREKVDNEAKHRGYKRTSIVNKYGLQ